MKRKIIRIDEEKCNGCGLCAQACHENAIGMVEGKAKLLRENYCDGLGDCLPACPAGAIDFEEREAPAYDPDAVEKARSTGGCPGSQSRSLRHEAPEAGIETHVIETHLHQWPVQMKLAPVNTPYFQGAHLLIAADCTAYAYGDFHRRFMKGRVTLIGCPKLDEEDYAEKLTAILQNNDIQSVTVLRMEVPCCGGIEQAVKRALQSSGKCLPWRVAVLSIKGEILSET